MEFASGLRLYDEAIVDHHVEPLADQGLSLVADDHAHFPTDPVTSRAQLPLEPHDVDVLEKPEAERVVHLVECTNDRPGQFLVDEMLASHATRYLGMRTPQSSIARPGTPIAAGVALSSAASAASD